MPKSKTELALEMVRHQRRQGIRFTWVGADGLYGNDPAFLRALDDDGECFLIDIHSDQRLYREDPEPKVLERQGPRGRVPRRLQARSEAIEARDWVARQPEADAKPALLDQVAVPGRQGAGRDRSLPSARLEVLASPHDTGGEGDAVPAGRRLRQHSAYPSATASDRLPSMQPIANRNAPMPWLLLAELPVQMRNCSACQGDECDKVELAACRT